MDTQHLKKTKSLAVNLGSILRIILWITLIRKKQFMTTCNLVRSKFVDIFEFIHGQDFGGGLC
jgi:hypothetical protein